jgi:hypothetical protein
MLNPRELRDLARLGAQARLDALDRERKAIYATFPQLRFRRGRSAGQGAETDGDRGATAKRPRRRMSRKARARIAEAQRKRWAEWKAKQSQTPSDESATAAAPARAPKKR